MQCPKCRHDNPQESLFCESCGGRLEKSCSACGAGVSPDARFCRKCGAVQAESSAEPARAPRTYTPKHLADKILNSRSALEGERKQVTILFADIKGSMELMEDLDPEEARRVVEPAVQLMIDGVHRYEGYVAQMAGDGIFAMFGAPIAHEDHAQRAVYAALLMQEKVAEYGEQLQRDMGLRLPIRVGINTGEVVVRSIRKDDLHTEYDSIGHSTGLASRMEALATPGSVVVSDHTHKLTEGYFKFHDLGPTRIKGLSDPIHVYEVEGVGPLRTRLQVSASHGLVHFVGRRRELEQMHEAVGAAKEGHGQIVGIMGDAGVGKSRLVYEFKVLHEAKCLVLEAFSVSHGKAHAYFPLIELLKSYFQLMPHDDERKRREKIGGKVLMLDRGLEDTLPYLLTLLGIGDRTSALQQMDPRIRRQRTMDAVKRLLIREGLNQPLILLFEDLQWIDDETQAFLDLLCESLATTNILLLVNYRPDYEHGWGSKTYYERLRLDPLGKKEAGELLTALVGDGAAAKLAPLRKLILEITQGNPFFMEEVVQTLAEEHVLAGTRGSYQLETPITEIHVPETVQGVLASRIDRLAPEEKTLLQTLAVIGKEFPLGLVCKVVEGSDDELHGLLSRLQAAEFIYEQPAFPDLEYTFKHALTQEVAYDSMLVERRNVIHERTGRAIEELYPYGLDAHYGDLARHYNRTDNAEKAAEYLYLAGQQALDRSAYAEANVQLSASLERIETLPNTSERAERELLAQMALGAALMVTRGWSAPEVGEAFTRAHELSRQVGGDFQVFPVLVGLVGYYANGGDLEKARELGDELLKLAQMEQDPGLLVVAHFEVGAPMLYAGEHCRARAHLEEAVALYDSTQHHALCCRYLGMDLGVVSLGLLASWVLWQLGYPDQAWEKREATLRLGEELSHPFSRFIALGLAAECCLLRGEWRLAQDLVEAGIAASGEHESPLVQVMGVFDRGWALSKRGRLEEGMQQMRQALDARQAVAFENWRSFHLALLAEAHATASQHEDALLLIVAALDHVETFGERMCEAEIHRIKGALLLLRPEENQAEAETCFHKAIDVARSQSTKSWELRASMSLARLWQQQGKTREARKLLSEIYGWFTEGFDTVDLKDAKGLLNELA